MRLLIMLFTILALVPASASLAIVYVDRNVPGPTHDGASWDTAFLKIQEGVDAATPNGEVWVADGTYVENVVMGEGVQLYGGFLGAEPGGYETNLSQRDFVANIAAIDGNRTRYRSCVEMPSGGRVDGFTVRDGDDAGIAGESIIVANNTLVGNNTAVSCGQASEVTYNMITGNGTGISCGGSSTVAYNYIAESTEVDSYGGGITCSGSTVIADNVIVDNCVYWYGGGIYCHGSPTITGNLIAGNSAHAYYGGGIYCDYGSSPTIRDNFITGNFAYAGGGIYCYGAFPSVVNNVISENTVWGFGGGIDCNDCWYRPPIISDNVIVGNTAEHEGGGISCRSQSRAVIVRNTISGNSSRSGAGIRLQRPRTIILLRNVVTMNCAEALGGGIYIDGINDSYAPPVVSGNIITLNTCAGAGGGLYCDNCEMAVTESTVAANSAPLGPGLGFDSYEQDYPSTVEMPNCILWNGPEQVRNNDGSRITITYSDVEGGWPGEGNLDADPMFVDPENGDYHLSPGSPCIDTGNTWHPDLLYQDIDGDPRVCDGDGDAIALVDMGADEYRDEYERTSAPKAWFVPGWVWFSVPLHPRWSADASQVLGYDCTNRLFARTEWPKIWLLYPDDFTDIDIGSSYVARLEIGEEHLPVYEGAQPDLPVEWTIHSAGWALVGVPATQRIHGLDLTLRVNDRVRTPEEDREAADPWLNWNWVFWYPDLQTAGIMDPFGAGDDAWLHPWWGYLVWSNTEDVTIVFP